MSSRPERPASDIDDCPFCSEFASGELPEAFRSYTRLRTRFLPGTDALRVLPSVTPLGVGHLMVVPVAHVQGVAQLSSVARGEITQLMSAYADRLRRAQRLDVALFEHGVGESRQGGCGISHAHVHLVPAATSVIADVKRQIRLDHAAVCEQDLGTFLAATARDESYLWFGANSSSVVGVRSEGIPSQYLRRVIGERLKRTWDWRALTGWRDFEASIRTLEAA